MVREYRERVLTRKLDRDGSRREEQTMTLAQVPVGVTMAVQSQSGRFSKKWEKIICTYSLMNGPD